MVNFDKNRPKKALQPNLIPLINVIFLMLIFFMVAGRVEEVDRFPIELPLAENTFADLNERPVIYISPKGQVAINNDLVTDSDLKTVIQAVVIDNPKQEIVIKADHRVPATRLLEIMQLIRKVGGASISLEAQVRS